MNTKQYGDLGEAKVMCKMLEKGYKVCIPFDDNSPYDLIVDINNKLYKVQCKLVSLKDGTITAYRFSTNRVEQTYNKNYYTADKIDVMALYCPDNDKVYVIPIEEFGDKITLRLRIEESKNSQVQGINYAKKYEI